MSARETKNLLFLQNLRSKKKNQLSQFTSERRQSDKSWLILAEKQLKW